MKKEERAIFTLSKILNKASIESVDHTLAHTHTIDELKAVTKTNCRKEYCIQAVKDKKQKKDVSCSIVCI